MTNGCKSSSCKTCPLSVIVENWGKEHQVKTRMEVETDGE